MFATDFNALANRIRNSSIGGDVGPVKQEVIKGSSFTSRQAATLMFMLDGAKREEILDQLKIEDPLNLKEEFKALNLSPACRKRHGI